MKIGVFDSGVGGLSVVRAIRQAMPSVEVIFKNDAEHVPYGTKSLSEIYNYTLPILYSLVNEGAKVIVIACNTVTTNFINELREELPVPLIGMEPMIKPAATASRSKIIAVCATPRTLESHRYQWLKQQFASGVKVLEPDCSDWAVMIEQNNIDRQKISDLVNALCQQGADQIVLGCTHYHWIEQIIRDAAKGRAVVNQPEQPVIDQLKRVTAQL